MQKTMFTEAYGVLLRRLVEARNEAGLTQGQLADLLDEPQQWVSSVETGKRRIDVIELRALCQARGIPVLDFLGEVERELS